MNRNLNQDLIKEIDYVTTDSVDPNDFQQGFVGEEQKVYEYQGKRYAKVRANTIEEEVTLSNGRTYKKGEYVWIAIPPLRWYVDLESGITFTEKLITPAQFNQIRNYKGDFENTDVYRFMNTHLIHNMSLENNSKKVFVDQSNDRKRNPYHFSFDPVTEEDIIKSAIESNVAVFLHGKSSVGKSARVEQLDPDCEILYLANASPESINGKSVYNSETHEMIDIEPTWYQNICNKCKEEPDKIHIVFMDELTNALPAIQNMAFNIVLKHEVNGKWKLPENCRIVAAGNELEDSLSANELTEPLFNRFAHVYIETNASNWLKWAITPNEEYERLDYEKLDTKSKIHPAVYSYIAYRGDEVLRTSYNGKTPNADPRKWELASKMLYKTNNPQTLRSLVGDKITRGFIEFCQQKVITLEDVLNNHYSEADLEMTSSEQYATAYALSYVDLENVVKVREFMKKVSDEARATFESLWINGNPQRLEKIAELKIEERGNLRR